MRDALALPELRAPRGFGWSRSPRGRKNLRLTRHGDRELGRHRAQRQHPHRLTESSGRASAGMARAPHQYGRGAWVFPDATECSS
jgi:hypothetical protein